MSNVFARCTALGLFAGGFALTGDLAWMAERGMRVLNSSSIPADDDAVPPAAAPPSAAEPPPPAPEPAPAPAANPASASSGPAAPTVAPHPDAGPVFQVGDTRPPSDGPERATMAAVDPGSRVVVWVAGAPGPAGGKTWRCLVFDVVDPVAAEALLYEAVSFSAAGQPIAAAAPPRRVRLTGPDLVRGQSFGLQRLGVAARADASADETIGPIVALAIVR